MQNAKCKPGPDNSDFIESNANLPESRPTLCLEDDRPENLGDFHGFLLQKRQTFRWNIPALRYQTQPVSRLTRFLDELDERRSVRVIGHRERAMFPEAETALRRELV